MVANAGQRVYMHIQVSPCSCARSSHGTDAGRYVGIQAVRGCAQAKTSYSMHYKLCFYGGHACACEQDADFLQGITPIKDMFGAGSHGKHFAGRWGQSCDGKLLCKTV